MPQMSSKTPQSETARSRQNTGAGPEGAALSPPPYGIDFIDRQAERENNTGLPDRLKAGIESLSGLAMDDVRVHYHSSKPAELQALAYTQGTDIFMGPGQERHLPHEAWHVVQQVQGRVQPTMQMKHGVPVNDDKGLEHEADVMGARALQMGGIHEARPDPGALLRNHQISHAVTQRLTEATIPSKDKGKYDNVLEKIGNHNKQFPAFQIQKHEITTLLNASTTVSEFGTKVVQKIKEREGKAKASPSMVEPEPPSIYEQLQKEGARRQPQERKEKLGSAVPGESKKKAEENAALNAMFSKAPYKSPTVISAPDPYAGLGGRAKVHATRLRTKGLGGTFSGEKDLTLNQEDINQLRQWVESQRTKGGHQKWVVNVGPGTGDYSEENQFKVSGFGTVTGSDKAPTYHITIKAGLM